MSCCVVMMIFPGSVLVEGNFLTLVSQYLVDCTHLFGGVTPCRRSAGSGAKTEEGGGASLTFQGG